jgi:hypothetical protein
MKSIKIRMLCFIYSTTPLTAGSIATKSDMLIHIPEWVEIEELFGVHRVIPIRKIIGIVTHPRARQSLSIAF